MQRRAPPATLRHVHAAVDIQDVTGDITRTRRAQKRNAVGDIVDATETTQGYRCHHLRLLIVA